ncbi:MAG: MMPL family transporter [Acidobacteriota bacterium]
MTRGWLPNKLARILMTFSRRRPGLVLVVFAVLLAAAGWTASRVRVNTDILSLMPAGNPVVEEFRSTLERFGSTDLLLGILDLEDRGADPDRLDPALAFADLLAEELRSSKDILWLEYHREDVSRAALELVPWAPLFMSQQGLDRLLADLGTEDGRRTQAAELAETVRSPTDLPFKALRRVDPLGMVPLALEGLELEDLGQRFDEDSGYLMDPEKRFVLLLAKPARPAADVAFGRQLMVELDGRRTAAETAWREGGFEGNPPPVLWGGGHAVAVADGELILGDLLWGSLLALLAVVTLFFIAFGRKVSLVVAFVPLVSGLVLTAAFTVVTLGGLNAVTAAFAALLIGLGIDFVIVLYGRYVEERSAGVGHDEALERCGRHTAASVMLGAVTTAATFFAFLVSDFQGLWQLGWLTGFGVLIVMLSVYLLLPALLTLAERRRAGRAHRMYGFGAIQLFRWSFHHPKPVLAASLVITAALGAAAFGVRYDDDALNMRSTENPGLQAQQQVMEAFGLRFNPYMLRLDGADEHDALAKTRALLPRVEALVDDGTLARVESVAPWIPEIGHQRTQLEKLRRFDAASRDLRAELGTAMEGVGLRPAAFDPGFDNLEMALTLDRPQGPTDLAATSLGHAMARYVAVSEGRASTVVYCYPPPGKWRQAPPPRLVQIAEEAGGVLTGGVVVSRELKRVVWRDATLAATLGTLVVFVFLAIDLGGLRPALLALLPLGMGLVWMLGWMALVDVPVNFLNLFVFTMVIGIGVDYGVHLLHRWQETRSLAQIEGMGAAITVAAFTTMLGFGSLVLSHFPGLRSMGAAAILGTLSAAWISITLLPALAGLGKSD